jgi:RNA polymerase sigma-70 factor (ECF subfamily)
LDDRTLINGIIAGDEASFRLLVEQYRDKVYSTCYGFVLNREDARDLAQEVFIEVHSSASRFRHESKLATWLYRIAVNKSLNFVKKKKKSSFIQSFDNKPLERLESVGAVDLEPQTSDVDAQEMSLILEKAVDSLPENQRIAFTLNKYDELPYRDIAEIMDVSVSSVESLIHRAKLRLQKKLSGYFEKK